MIVDWKNKKKNTSRCETLKRIKKFDIGGLK